MLYNFTYMATVGAKELKERLALHAGTPSPQSYGTSHHLP